MTTATWTSRFSNLAMSTDQTVSDDKTLSGVALNFPLAKTIWANTSGRGDYMAPGGGKTSSFSAVAPAYDAHSWSGSEDASQSAAGFGPVSSNIDETWGTWNAAEAKSVARSVSPARSRDDIQGLQASNGVTSYLDMSTAAGTIGSIHGYPRDLDDGRTGLNRASFASNYGGNTSQESSGFPDIDRVFGPISRGQTMTPPSKSSNPAATDLMPDMYSFGGRSTPGRSLSSAQRVKMNDMPINSRPYSSNNGRQQQDVTDLGGHRSRNLKFGESATAPQGIGGGGGGIPNTIPSSFSTGLSMPASQPSLAAGAPPPPQPWSAMLDFSASGASAKGSADRIPASPRLFSPSAEAWSRPTSRDARPVAILDSHRAAQPPPHYFYHSNNPYPTPAPAPAPTANFAGLYPQMQFDVGQMKQNMSVPSYPIGVGNLYFNNQPTAPASRPARDHYHHDPTQGARSSLLEMFRRSKSPRCYELKDIYDHVVEFSGDQHGSRFIQSKLEDAKSDEKEHVFREIVGNAIRLMKDVFGNYVIQKFFEHGNQIQKKILASHMRGKIADLSVQMYACRVVQTALEHILCEQAAELVSELRADILRIIRDQNGNHVVQKIIAAVPREHWGFIVDAMRGQVSQFSSHLYGCRVIQRLLEKGSEQDKVDLMDELHQAAPALISDQYGNYVAQHIIQHGKPEDRSRFIWHVTNNIIRFSQHKFASNVVEKCIVHGSAVERSNILKLLITPAVDGINPLNSMMKDQYGNYVIQTMLGQLEGDEKTAFIREMQPHFAAAKKGSASRQLTALEKMVQPAALQVDVKSATPTPSLTNGLNSPQSSSAPSTTASAMGEGLGEQGLTEKAKAGIPTAPAVRVQET